MKRFRIELAPAAQRDLDAVDEKTSTDILSDLRALEENPFPRGKLIKKIRGKRTSYYRLRIDKLRVFCEIQHKNVVILRVIDKKESERFIKKL